MTAISEERSAAAFVVHLPPLRPLLRNAVRLLIETMVIPTLLLGLMAHAGGLVAGLAAVLAWYYLCVSAHWLRGRRSPGAFTTGACMTLATSTAVLAYLAEPALGSCCMGALFLGSALARRPLTEKMAMDLVRLPAHIFGQPVVARVLRGLALLWGASRLADAGITYGLTHSGAASGALPRALLTLISLAVCLAWGWRSLRANGVELRRTPSRS